MNAPRSVDRSASPGGRDNSLAQIRSLLTLSFGQKPANGSPEWDYFALRHLQCESLETIIRKLADGDSEYQAKYSFELRIQLVLGVLQALAYAHEGGVVHRNLRPACVMVGRQGEVVVMDRALDEVVAGIGAAIEGQGGTGEELARKYVTQAATLIGMAAYMSPEQARGETDKIDARSDLYSAVVLLHELMGLKHYLSDQRSAQAMLRAITSEPVTFSSLLAMRYPDEKPKREILHLVAKGLSKDPARRFQTASELINALYEILEGRFLVMCHLTFTRRVLREVDRGLDRAPRLGLMTLLGLWALIVFALVQLVRMAIT